MGVRRWMFFHPNDGTRPYPDNNPEHNNVLWERIQDLEDTVERQRTNIDHLNERLQQYIGRYSPNNILVVRDEQRIDRSITEHFENTQTYFEHMRRDQARRMGERLLEEEFIQHTFSPDEPNGDYISRMILRIQNNN